MNRLGQTVLLVTELREHLQEYPLAIPSYYTLRSRATYPDTKPESNAAALPKPPEPVLAQNLDNSDRLAMIQVLFP